MRRAKAGLVNEFTGITHWILLPAIAGSKL